MNTCHPLSSAPDRCRQLSEALCSTEHSAEDRAALLAHIRECRQCSAEWETVDQISSLRFMGELPEPPADLALQIRLAGRREGRRLRRMRCTGAFLAASIAAGFALTLRTNPTAVSDTVQFVETTARTIVNTTDKRTAVHSTFPIPRTASLPPSAPTAKAALKQSSPSTLSSTPVSRPTVRTASLSAVSRPIGGVLEIGPVEPTGTLHPEPHHLPAAAQPDPAPARDAVPPDATVMTASYSPEPVNPSPATTVQQVRTMTARSHMSPDIAATFADLRKALSRQPEPARSTHELNALKDQREVTVELFRTGL